MSSSATVRDWWSIEGDRVGAESAIGKRRDHAIRCPVSTLLDGPRASATRSIALPDQEWVISQATAAEGANLAERARSRIPVLLCGQPRRLRAFGRTTVCGSSQSRVKGDPLQNT